jgi:4-amino-4-deoxy-L-arabinose transferase-like glycosyltransferase
MDQPRDTRNDTVILVAVALCVVLLHTLTNGRYGFHRDELATIDDARHLFWGYVVYPPLTPFLARVALELFGTSLRGARFFSALAQAISLVLAGLMARELGGSGWLRLWLHWPSQLPRWRWPPGPCCNTSPSTISGGC